MLVITECYLLKYWFSILNRRRHVSSLTVLQIDKHFLIFHRNMLKVVLNFNPLSVRHLSLCDVLVPSPYILGLW